MDSDKKYYVYELINPIKNKVFYVGKGQTNRMYVHQSNVRHGKSTHNNWELFREIKSIIDAGSSVKYNKVYHTDVENDAYDYEEKLIALYGLDNLCNIFDKHRRVYSGELHPMYGKRHSDETKIKIGIKSKGRKFTLESRMKMGSKGDKHPLYGIGHSIATRKKMSENHADFNGEKNPFYGKTHNDYTKAKISNKLKKEYKIKFPNDKIIKFIGSDSVKYFTERYNSITHQKISYHSIFQYGINKHGWKLINE
jgi:hypothetical protein